MTHSSSILEDLRDIFLILHDGYTSSWRGSKNLLTLKVDCNYLAERIDKSYTSFYIEFEKIEKLEFFPWMNPKELQQIILNDIEGIFKVPLEILSAEIKDNFVSVVMNQSDLDFDYCGGLLSISCSGIKVFDQGRHELTINQFGEICKGYWNDVAKEQERRIAERKGN